MIQLNKEQQQAVEIVEGPVRIIAGPGSGKTRTIVSKIAHILQNNLAKPSEILAITFTNKAANEIKERIIKESNISFVNVFTYHGWCNYFLRLEHSHADLDSDFRIIDQSDSQNRVKKLIDSESYTVDKSDAMNAFGKIAREEESVDDFLKSSNQLKVEIAKLWDKYNINKKDNGELDFNDLISEVKTLLSNNEEVATKWKNRYKYIFIDEFQDTNNVQFEIIKSITDENSNLTVVGDPDQNIYSWRGANINIINNFNKWYPTAQTVMLRTNYRSTPEIIDAANKLIVNNDEREETFFAVPNKRNGKEVNIKRCTDDGDEAFWLGREIKKLINDRKCNLQDIAVIVRSSYKTRPLETAFNYLNVPYKVIGAMKFFDRAEVKQTLRFVQFAARQDNNSLLDIINNPPKKFGPSKSLKVQVSAEDQNLSMWEYLKENKDKENDELKYWINLTEKFISDINNEVSLYETIWTYINDIGYLNRIYDEENRVENVKESINIIVKAINNRNKTNTVSESIKEFVNNISLTAKSDETMEEGSVNIITSHASKGTEFPVVFIFNAIEGHWPSDKSVKEGYLEEERRVLYVAMTRAMDYLYITTSDGFTKWNKPIEESRFIDEFASSNEYNYIESTNIQSSEVPEEIYNMNEIGKNIIHRTLGEGTIIDKDSDYIKVKFSSGDIVEILIGHQSYKIC